MMPLQSDTKALQDQYDELRATANDIMKGVQDRAAANLDHIHLMKDFHEKKTEEKRHDDAVTKEELSKEEGSPMWEEDIPFIIMFCQAIFMAFMLHQRLRPPPPQGFPGVPSPLTLTLALALNPSPKP